MLFDGYYCQSSTLISRTVALLWTQYSSQEVPYPLRNSKVYFQTHSSQLSDPVLSHVTPIHTLPSTFLNICFPIIFPSTPKSFEKSLPFTSPVQNLYAPLNSHSCYITCSSRPSFNGIISTLWKLSITNVCIRIFPQLSFTSWL